MKIKRALEGQFDIGEVRDIFFKTSMVKAFSNHNEKEKFFHLWCGQYLNTCPTQFYLALKEKKIIGYLAGHTNSRQALKEFKIPGYEFFEKHYDKYPAHLHINCDANFQGKGVGTKLMEKFMTEVREKELPGVHIVTSIGAKNSGFYASLDFDIIDYHDFKNTRLLFMGKSL